MRGQWSCCWSPARLCLRLLLLLGYRRRRHLCSAAWYSAGDHRQGLPALLLYNSFGGSDTAVDAAFEPHLLAGGQRDPLVWGGE